jgi:hypothetical protein
MNLALSAIGDRALYFLIHPLLRQGVERDHCSSITKNLTKIVEFNKFFINFCERSHKIEIYKNS